MQIAGEDPVEFGERRSRRSRQWRSSGYEVKT
jgi:hypothetical protein